VPEDRLKAELAKLTRRLKRGRFIWPTPADGVVAI
jgi:hypothetical protein